MGLDTACILISVPDTSSWDTMSKHLHHLQQEGQQAPCQELTAACRLHLQMSQQQQSIALMAPCSCILGMQ